MSGSQVQYLAKRCARLEAQVELLLRSFDGISTENEVLTSIACAFAWDLVTTHGHHWVGHEVAKTQIACWDEAVKAVGGLADEAAGIERAADGSIISILPPKVICL